MSFEARRRFPPTFAARGFPATCGERAIRGVASCAAVGASPVAGLTDDGWAESLAGDEGKAEYSKYASQTGLGEACLPEYSGTLSHTWW